METASDWEAKEKTETPTHHLRSSEKGKNMLVFKNVNSDNGGDTYPVENINVIVQKSLDKFGEGVIPLIQGMAADIKNLVKAVTKAGNVQDSGPTTRSGPQEVSEFNANRKKMDKKQRQYKGRDSIILTKNVENLKV